MPVSRPLYEMEITLAEEYNGEYFSFHECARRRITQWARVKTDHGTLYERFEEFLTHDSISECENCGRVGEWIVSDVCVRCHAAICSSCSRLHHKMAATICRNCYIRCCHEFLRDARRSERRRVRDVNKDGVTIHASQDKAGEDSPQYEA